MNSHQHWFGEWFNIYFSENSVLTKIAEEEKQRQMEIARKQQEAELRQKEEEQQRKKDEELEKRIQIEKQKQKEADEKKRKKEIIQQKQEVGMEDVFNLLCGQKCHAPINVH